MRQTVLWKDYANDSLKTGAQERWKVFRHQRNLNNEINIRDENSRRLFVKRLCSCAPLFKPSLRRATERHFYVGDAELIDIPSLTL